MLAPSRKRLTGWATGMPFNVLSSNGLRHCPESAPAATPALLPAPPPDREPDDLHNYLLEQELRGWRPMKAWIRRIAIATFKAVHSLWLMVGIGVGILVVAESCYRIQAGARKEMSQLFAGSSSGTPAAAPQHPVRSQPWFSDWNKEFIASSPQAWKPYVYFRRAGAYHGQYVSVDSLRHRVTPQPLTPLQPALRVFLFGGSTMWGSFQRDDHTIAAETARRLQPLAGPGARIEVVNFAESGHVFTQGLIELMLQLRRGNHPDVVLFYDGINDTFSAIQNGVAGYGQNEQNRVNEFATGRALAWGGHDDGVVKDLHAFGVLSLNGMSRLRLVQRLQQVVHPNNGPNLISADSAARDVTRIYAENVRIIESLARTYGFTAVYVWQPSLHATEKVLTPYEAGLMRGIAGDPVQRRLQEAHRRVLPLLDSAMSVLGGGRFVNEGRLFKGDTMAVYADPVGHNTEASVPTIVNGFWPTLEAVVRAALKKP